MEKKALKKGDQWIITILDPFQFAGETVETIDLNGLFDLTGRDLCQIDDQMMARGYTGQNMELTKRYALLTVAKVCGKPWENAENMRSRDVTRMKNIISIFFYTWA